MSPHRIIHPLKVKKIKQQFNNEIKRVLVFTRHPGPRLRYVLNYLQHAYQDLTFIEVSDLSVYLDHQGPSVQHGQESLKVDELRIPLSASFKVPYIELGQHLPSIETEFLKALETPLSVDLFAQVFWQLSRLEEYFSIEKDKHQRYPAAASMLYRHGQLKFPVVDHWIDQFIEHLKEKTSLQYEIKPESLAWSVGVDVDQFYKHAYKPLFKQSIGSLLEICKGRWTEVRQRLAIYFGFKKDPFDCFEKLLQMGIPRKQLIFFLLSGGSTSFDKNHPLKTPVVSKLLAKLDKDSTLAIHPSYAGGMNESVLLEECLMWGSVIGRKPELSRQHYIRISLPGSYRLLEKAGIHHDYSMGYPEIPGFRAGTTKTFRWYDLEEDRETTLMIHPFVAMDRTYLSYLNKGPKESLENLFQLMSICHRYRGVFHVVWHNSSFDFEGEWKGWEGVFESMLYQLKEHQTVLFKML